MIGAGMKSHPGVAAKTFATLEAAGIAAGGRLDLADQDRLPHPDRPRRRGRPGAARGLRARSGPVSAADRRRRRDRRGRRRHARPPARARLRRRAALRLGAFGRHAARRAHRRGGDPRGACPRRRRPLSLLGRHRRLARARPARGARRRRRDRQVVCVPPRARASRSSCPRSTACARSRATGSSPTRTAARSR